MPSGREGCADLHQPGSTVCSPSCTAAAAPISSARAAARLAGSRATVKEYDIGHFDIYADEGVERAVRDQIQFLTRALQAPLPAAP